MSTINESAAVVGVEVSETVASHPDTVAANVCGLPPAPPEEIAQEETVAAERQDEDSAAALLEAKKTLRAFGAECRSAADRNFRRAELADKYVRQYLSISESASRATAVEELAEEWRQYDEESISSPVVMRRKHFITKVSALLKVNAVRQLIGDGKGVVKGSVGGAAGKRQTDSPLPWGILVEFAPLVLRVEGQHAETWTLVDKVSVDGAKALMGKACDGLKRKDVADAVKLLLGIVPVPEEPKAAPRSVAEQVNAANDAAVDAAGEEEGDIDLAEETQGECRQATPLSPMNVIADMAKQGTPKDVADMLSQVLFESDVWEDVLEELIRRAKGHKDVSRPTHRACDAFLFSFATSKTLAQKVA